jgi:hypothetical protein
LIGMPLVFLGLNGPSNRRELFLVLQAGSVLSSVC